MSEEYLFIGGPLDGQLRLIDDPSRVFVADVLTENFHCARFSVDELPVATSFERVEYRPQAFSADGRYYMFYVMSGTKSSDVLELLRKTYSKSKSSKRRSR